MLLKTFLPHTISRACSYIVIFIGLIVLVGWHTQTKALIQVNSSFAPMQYNTALGFLFAGIALFAATTKEKRLTLSIISSVIVILIGGLTIIEYIGQINLYIDELFIEHYITVKTSLPGRMAPNTAFCFLLSGITLFLLNYGSTLHFLKLMGSIVVGLSLVAFLSYFLSVETAYGWEHLTQMAVHTSVGFIFLGLGINLWGCSLSKKEYKKTVYLTPTMLSITLLIFVLSLWLSLKNWQETHIQERISVQLVNIKEAFELKLSSQIKAIERMSQRWEYRKGEDRQEWKADSKSYVGDLANVQAIGWVDAKKKISWLSPTQGNEALLNLELENIPIINNLLVTSRNSRQTEVSSNPSAILKNKGFIVIVPLFVDENFDGYIIALFKLDELLPVFSSYSRVQENFHIELYESHNQPRKVLTSSTHVNSLQSSIELTLADASWRIQLTPTESYVKEFTSILPNVVLVMGLIFTFFIFMLQSLRSKDRLKTQSLENEISLHAATKEKLTYEESRLRITLETMADAVVLADQRGDILSFNKAATIIFGYEESEILGKNVRILMPQPDSKQHDSYLKNYLGGGEPQIIGKGRDVIALRKNGEAFPIYLAISDMELEGSHFFSAVIRDISQQKESEKALKKYTNDLERSNKELDDFAYVASHDLKAPLRGIMQLSTWIKADLDGNINEEVEEYFTLMQGRITRLEKLLDDLLSYSRAGRQHGNISEVDVELTVCELFELLDPPETFELKYQGDIFILNTLVVPLELILRNLINNAIKHHHDPDNGAIIISVNYIDSIYHFSIWDNGPGIRPEFHEQVFTIFQTLKPRDEVEASGMGLTIVKKLVSRYGGAISIESDGHSGTMYEFYLA